MLFGVVIVLPEMARRRMWKVSMLLRIERFFSVDFANYLKDVALKILAYSRTHFGGRRRILKFSEGSFASYPSLSGEDLLVLTPFRFGVGDFSFSGLVRECLRSGFVG